MYKIASLLILSLSLSSSLIPPMFQWKIIDFAWEGNARDAAIASGAYIPENNMPTGLARWKDKLFITIPRWKTGVPSSLNYVNVGGGQQQPLNPYPSWQDGFIRRDNLITNSTVVSTFRVEVDKCDRLWAVDNGVTDMANDVKQIAEPAIVVFDLNTDTLLHRFLLPDDVLRDTSVFTSIVVDINSKKCKCDDSNLNTFVYITDMGSNAIIVYNVDSKDAWRVEHPYFKFDPNAGVFAVGGIDFFWNDGVSAATLSAVKKDGYKDLYLHPTSSTKLFKVSTKLLKNKDVSPEELFDGVEVVGDRGPKSQATACAFDKNTNVLFYTQLNKNGVGCWNVEKPFNKDNTPVIISDCTLFEFPNDIKVDHDGDLWILSDRQSRFLYSTIDIRQINFRIMTAPVSTLVKDTPCEKMHKMEFIKKKFCSVKV